MPTDVKDFVEILLIFLLLYAVFRFMQGTIAGRVVRGLGFLLMLVLFGALYAFLRRPIDEGVGPRGITYRLPLIGRMRVYATKASFAATLALLMRRAMPLPKALRLTAEATDDREIRAKVEQDPANPVLITTIRGLGYKFSG